MRRLKELKQLNKLNNKIHFTQGGLFHLLKDNDRIYKRAPNDKDRKGIIERKSVQHDGNNNGTANSSANNSGTASNLIVSTSNDATMSPHDAQPLPNRFAPSSRQFIGMLVKMVMIIKMVHIDW